MAELGVSPTFDSELLFEYCHASDFPFQLLQQTEVSNQGIDFVKRLMVADSKDRISASAALTDQSAARGSSPDPEANSNPWPVISLPRVQFSYGSKWIRPR